MSRLYLLLFFIIFFVDVHGKMYECFIRANEMNDIVGSYEDTDLEKIYMRKGGRMVIMWNPFWCGHVEASENRPHLVLLGSWKKSTDMNGKQTGEMAEMTKTAVTFMHRSDLENQSATSDWHRKFVYEADFKDNHSGMKYYNMSFDEVRIIVKQKDEDLWIYLDDDIESTLIKFPFIENVPLILFSSGDLRECNVAVIEINDNVDNWAFGKKIPSKIAKEELYENDQDDENYINRDLLIAAVCIVIYLIVFIKFLVPAYLSYQDRCENCKLELDNYCRLQEEVEYMRKKKEDEKKTEKLIVLARRRKTSRVG